VGRAQASTRGCFGQTLATSPGEVKFRTHLINETPSRAEHAFFVTDGMWTRRSAPKNASGLREGSRLQSSQGDDEVVTLLGQSYLLAKSFHSRITTHKRKLRISQIPAK
jgi:hypothetical protein